VRFNKKLFSHSCHEFKPRAVRAQALAAVACGGACASVFWFDSSLGRNYFSPHRFRPCDTIRLLNFETNLVSAVSESLTRAALSTAVAKKQFPIGYRSLELRRFGGF